VRMALARPLTAALAAGLWLWLAARRDSGALRSVRPSLVAEEEDGALRLVRVELVGVAVAVRLAVAGEGVAVAARSCSTIRKLRGSMFKTDRTGGVASGSIPSAGEGRCAAQSRGSPFRGRPGQGCEGSPRPPATPSNLTPSHGTLYNAQRAPHLTQLSPRRGPSMGSRGVVGATVGSELVRESDAVEGGSGSVALLPFFFFFFVA
jgi:hypothetical protein